MANITKVPNRPLVKKKGPFKGSTLKAGGTVKKAANGTTTSETTKKPTNNPTYKNLGLARSATNKEEGRDINTPATKKDSIDYKKGFEMGKAGFKPSPLRAKYEGKNQYEEKGRWEGQNPKKKTGGTIKKAKAGTSLKSVPSDKVGLGKLPTPVRNKMGYKKDGGTIKAKSGGKMKTCKGGC